MQKSRHDVWVGLFVLIGAAAVLFLALKAGNLLSLNFDETYEVAAKFDNIGGLKPRAAVKSAGVVVGRVESIGFDDKTYQARVVLNLEKRFAFPKDSSAKILTSGLLGEQYLGLEPGVADTGDLDADLISLFQAVGEAARERKTVLVLFIDELQYVAEPQLAALITALHRCAQLQLPVTLVGAGLPQLVGQMGKARSYAERLFEFTLVGPLADSAARLAIIAPAQRRGVEFAPAALDEILLQTAGYPYFLQEWGKHSWTCAQSSPIQLADVHAATQQAMIDLDSSFFRLRLDRLTPSEKRYLRAMAELGPGPHRSGDIAERLARKVTALGPTRNQLISKA